MARKKEGIIDRQMNEAKKRLEAKNETQEKPVENQAQTEKTEPEAAKVETKQPEPKKVEKPKGDSVITNTPLLEESVNRTGRDYTKLEINGEPPERTEVPIFVRPTVDLPTGSGDVSNGGGSSEGKEPKSEPSNSGGGGNEPPAKTTIANKESGDSSKESRQKSALLVESAIFAWDFLWGKIGDAMELSVTKLEKKAIKGLLDLRVLDRRLEDGRTVGQVIKDYNEKVRDDTDPDEELEEDLKPFLIKVFTKNGWGFSDEQYIMFKLVVFTVNRAIGLGGRYAAMMSLLKKESQDVIQENGGGSTRQTVVSQTNKETISPEPVSASDMPQTVRNEAIETVDYELMPEGVLDTEEANKVIAKNKNFPDVE